MVTSTNYIVDGRSSESEIWERERVVAAVCCGFGAAVFVDVEVRGISPSLLCGCDDGNKSGCGPSDTVCIVPIVPIIIFFGSTTSSLLLLLAATMAMAIILEE